MVRKLVAAGLEGMMAVAEGTSAAEVTSACMTITLNTIQAAKERGADLEGFRDGIARMYAELPPVTAH